jgi:hypothetical protein
MATHAHSTPIAAGRRRLPGLPAIPPGKDGAPRRAPVQASASSAAGLDLSDYLPTPANSSRIAALAASLLDWLDATAPDPDMEPDVGDEEDGEDSE